MKSYQTIYALVSQIPKGKVATYGQIADLCGLFGKARLVGYALFRLDPGELEIPWHRVINAKGEISYSPRRQGADHLQRQLLTAEGIRFDAQGKVNLTEYRWEFS
ncbi:MAG: MGMT family protein [Pseudanabaenaceae cyanobacterium bins.68]|nr:MGMT family protein [Pseudanabaenaceae cyanobacterium bins.68]